MNDRPVVAVPEFLEWNDTVVKVQFRKHGRIVLGKEKKFICRHILILRLLVLISVVRQRRRRSIGAVQRGSSSFLLLGLPIVFVVLRIEITDVFLIFVDQPTMMLITRTGSGI